MSFEQEHVTSPSLLPQVRQKRHRLSRRRRDHLGPDRFRPSDDTASLVSSLLGPGVIPSFHDLGNHEWHEEGGFYHGYSNAVYYRMVCNSQELDAVRTQLLTEKEEYLDDNMDDLWLILTMRYVDPAKSFYGAYESSSPFEEDVQSEWRRRIIALNMGLDPTTTTWYGLGKEYEDLMQLRLLDQRATIKKRLRAQGITPAMERNAADVNRRATAFFLNLNPYTTTWDEILAYEVEIHRVILPIHLASRMAPIFLSKPPQTFNDFILHAVESYLNSPRGESELCETYSF